MASYDPSFDYMIHNEDFTLAGKVTPEPNGGKARFGINSVAHPEVIASGFYDMDVDAALEYAKDFFFHEYWNGRGFAEIDNQALATKLFDMAVNMGNGGEIGVLQEALGLHVDHGFGPITKAALMHAPPDFMAHLVTALKLHYQKIHDAHPEKYADVIEGWLNRAGKVPQ